MQQCYRFTVYKHNAHIIYSLKEDDAAVIACEMAMMILILMYLHGVDTQLQNTVHGEDNIQELRIRAVTTWPKQTGGE